LKTTKKRRKKLERICIINPLDEFGKYSNEETKKCRGISFLRWHSGRPIAFEQIAVDN